MALFLLELYGQIEEMGCTMSKKQEKGFTLIELGVVVAVMAVLSLPLLAGQGFMGAAKGAKALNGIAQTKLAVETQLGLWAGKIPDSMYGAGTGPAFVAHLVVKGLVSVNGDNHIELAKGYKIIGAQLGGGSGDDLGFHIQAPSQQAADDLHLVMRDDPHYFISSFDGSVCDGQSDENGRTHLCFDSLI